MDKSALTQAMKASISEVLEQMFFLPIDFTALAAVPPDTQSSNTLIIAKLGFQGATSGTFMLMVPLTLAQSVSADFFGTDPRSLSKDQVADTILEMVNMLAGSTLSYYDRSALFDLQIPELITLNQMSDITGRGPQPIVLSIQTPQSWIAFVLALEQRDLTVDGSSADR